MTPLDRAFTTWATRGHRACGTVSDLGDIEPTAPPPIAPSTRRAAASDIDYSLKRRYRFWEDHAAWERAAPLLALRRRAASRASGHA